VQFLFPGENVKYVQLNWEDILGGKDGLNALRVTMAPPTKDNPNRQLNIGFGSGTGTYFNAKVAISFALRAISLRRDHLGYIRIQ
jgi:hypothetical protein